LQELGGHPRASLVLSDTEEAADLKEGVLFLQRVRLLLDVDMESGERGVYVPPEDGLGLL